MQKEEELILIKSVQAGDTQAFENLVDLHKKYVFNIVFNILKSREDAEEVSMDVFIKVYQKIDSFQFDAKFSTWLYTIAYRQAIMLLRKKKAYFDELTEKHHVAAVEVDVMHQQEQRMIIETALNELETEERTMMTLFYLNELSLKEVADVMEVKAETIKVKIHRLRKKLQQILEKQLPDFELASII